MMHITSGEETGRFENILARESGTPNATQNTTPNGIRNETPSGIPHATPPSGGDATTNRLRAIIDALVGALVTINAEGEIIDFNAAAERTFGYRREEVLGTPLSGVIILPSQRDARQRGMSALLKTGWGNILRERVEVAALGKDGSETPVELMITQIPGETPPIFTASIQEKAARDVVDRELCNRAEEYRLLFETNPTPMWIFDADTLGFLAVNQAAIEQYGYSREEFLALSLRDICPVEDLPQFRQTPGEGNGTGSLCQWQFRRKDGALICLTISPITFERRAARLIVATDITERQLAEEKVSQSEANLALAQRIAGIGSWEMDLTSPEDRAQHPPHWSDETFRILGLDPATTTVTHGTFGQLLHPDDRLLAREAFLQQRRTGASQQIDYRVIVSDGSERLVHFQSEAVRDESGQVVKIVGTVQDRTEQMREQRSLRQKAELLNLAPVAIFVSDLDGTIRLWNPGAESLYGWTRQEAIGKRAVDFLRQDRARSATAEEELLRTGEWRGELDQLCKDGRKIVVNSRWTLVCNQDGEPQSVLVLNSDVTEQKKIEQQSLRAQRLESIGTLTAGVAHDLNNILAPIILISPLLRGDLPQNERETLLSVVQMSAERGANLARQMITFAHGADGERLLVQPSHLIEESAKIAGQTFPKSITIRTKYPPDLWMVEVDPAQLQQVLLNLAVNARDAMPTGGTLHFTGENFNIDEQHAGLTPGAQSGPYVLFQVTDNGTGIPGHIIDRIFDPFFTTKEVGQGTGLGLSTAIGIVKGYGGFVNVSSEPGHSTFKIFLPASNATSASPEHGGSLSAPSGHGERILIVDDEPSVRTATQSILERSGYQPLVAEDGISALALYAQQPTKIDLILTDLVMPFMDGLMLTRAVRKLNPQQKILLSTGCDDDLQSSEIKSLGLNACLVKPHSCEKLLSLLEETLRGDHVVLQPGALTPLQGKETLNVPASK